MTKQIQSNYLQVPYLSINVALFPFHKFLITITIEIHRPTWKDIIIHKADNAIISGFNQNLQILSRIFQLLLLVPLFSVILMIQETYFQQQNLLMPIIISNLTTIPLPNNSNQIQTTTLILNKTCPIMND